ncbi:MAG: hypothetical protein HC778_04720 [Chamaesiphon sp. CSU_1_12]|nr:hypothetical protein [Chamaesiphon sp. CSU_1_12]
MPNEVLARCGLIPASEPAVSPAKSVVIAQPLPTIPEPLQSLNCPTTSAIDDDSARRTLRERSEAEDDRQTHAGMKLSSSVASFLYGES